MLIRPKKSISSLHRVPNETVDRLEYLRLDKNENIVGFSDEVLDDFRKLITSDFITAYPDSYPLYQKLAGSLGVSPKQLYLASGSDGAIKSVFEVYVDIGDEVLLISPTYAMFFVYAKMFQARLVEVFYDEQLHLSAEQILAKLSPVTRLICIANPNSPTGTVLSQQEIQRVIETARANGTLVLIDEAYYQYHGESAIGLLDRYDNLILTRTFSKAMGLASARLGFVVSAEGVIADLFQSRPLYEVNAFAVRLGLYLLDHPQLVFDHVEQIIKAKAFLEQALCEIGLMVRESHANFVLIHVGGRERAAKIVEWMRRERILIKGGFREPCLQPFVRITLGSVSQMECFVRKLRLALQQLPASRPS